MTVFRNVEDRVGFFFYGWWVFRRVSKLALGNRVWLMFKWLLAVYST